MALKPCLVCGDVSAQSRCAEHRLPDRKAPAAARGYGPAWTRLSKRARRLQPWCSDCGSTHDLQLDHTPETWARHDAGLPIRLEDTGGVCCGPCNRARGQARPRGGTPSAPPNDPRPKAKFETHSVET